MTLQWFPDKKAIYQFLIAAQSTRTGSGITELKDSSGNLTRLHPNKSSAGNFQPQYLPVREQS